MFSRLVAWLLRLNRRRLLRRKAARQAVRERAWFASNDPGRDDIAAALRQRNAALAARPLLSIVPWPAASESARSPHWPFAGDAPSIYPEWELLRSGAPVPGEADPPRVRRIESAGATDAADIFRQWLETTRGEAIVVMPPDGLLVPHALLLIAETVARFPRFGLIYGDEARQRPSGELYDPDLRCDFNLELLRSWNYLDGLVVVPRHVLERSAESTVDDLAVGGWSWLLRMAESAAPGQIIHVPHVLCHRTAPRAALPRPVVANGVEVSIVQHHLDRVACPATARPAPEGGIHIAYAVPTPAPLVSIVIPTRDGLALLRRCIDSILTRSTYPHYEIIVVDNGSVDQGALDYLQHLSGHPRVTVMRDPRPFNYSALNNAAAARCRGDLLALLNNDIEVISPGWLEEMVGLALRRDVGAVGARLWYPDETLQHAGVVLGILGIAGHVHRRLPRGDPGFQARALLTQEVSAVTAACLVLRRDVFQQVRGLDEQHLAVDFNDIDLCLRIGQAGYKVIWTPHAELYHHEGATRGRRRSEAHQQRFDREYAFMQASWGWLLSRDPAYNPHLTLTDCDLSISESPRVNLLAPWYEQIARRADASTG